MKVLGRNGARGLSGSVRRFAGAAALLLSATLSASGQQTVPRLNLNETYVEEITKQSTLDIKDKAAVFAFVFAALPERVKVFPTENYYYFKFHHGGQAYSGNIRLENELRDQGKIHFAYGEDFVEFLPPGELSHILFDRSHGIETEKIDDLTYKLTHQGKSVTFELNDMSKVKPPAGMLGADERYLGPVFDESAVRFFLVYNGKLKVFHYLLDETVPPSDIFVHSGQNDRLIVGKRTGFAYYRDHKLDRKILIGVYEGNIAVNNYFDGPFDQLPDNFLDGDSLKNAIIEVEPGMQGKIDRYGSSFDGESRYMIAPYLQYRALEDLNIFHRCATNKSLAADLYHACFAIESAESERPTLVADRLARERRQPAQRTQQKRQR